MGVVTVDELTLAIKNSIDSSHGMVEEQAYIWSPRTATRSTCWRTPAS